MNSHTMTEEAIYRERHEAVAILMDKVYNPEMLYNLVASSAVAEDTFERWPSHYLPLSLSDFPKDIRRLAMAHRACAEEIMNSEPYTSDRPNT